MTVPPDGTLTGSRTGVLAGRVAGAVLAVIRRDIPVTQEDLAARLRVSPATVQAWEQGRKPLVNAPFARLQNLRRELHAAGAAPGLLSLWDKALQADVTLAALDTASPAAHPLALVVPDRAMTELLAWPLGGPAPRQTGDTKVVLAAGQAEIAAVTAALREAANQAGGDGEKAAMLRRQVKFLLANARDQESRQWAEAAQARDLRSPGPLDTWTPGWPVARSAAVSAAQAGNLDPLHRFTSQALAGDQLIAANLRYWAYWAGEYPAPWSGDSAMADGDQDDWTGTRLLATLLQGLASAPYRDLCAHSLWALLLCRRHLASSPQWQPRIQAAAARALEDGALERSARQRVEQISYLVRTP